jgi:hypothetical protein
VGERIIRAGGGSIKLYLLEGCIFWRNATYIETAHLSSRLNGVFAGNKAEWKSGSAEARSDDDGGLRP